MNEKENFKENVNRLMELIDEANYILRFGWFSLSQEQRHRLSVLNDEITELRMAIA
jgi:hypothetical protein